MAGAASAAYGTQISHENYESIRCDSSITPMHDAKIRLIEKIRTKANTPGGAISAAYLAGLRDAEEFLRDLDAMDAPLAEKKYQLKQQFLELMKQGEETALAREKGP